MGYKKAVETAKDNDSKSSNSQETGQQAGENLSGQLDSISDGLADNIVNMVGATAFKKAFTRLGSGDFGKFAPAMISNFEKGLLSPFETSIAELESWEESPKALPPSPEKSSTL